MKNERESRLITRRSMAAGSAAILAGGAMAAYAAVATNEAGDSNESPALPWEWAELDPLEAGRRSYRFYKEKGGCGTASFLGMLSLLKEQVGYPWTTLPDMMMAHAASGFGGHGTLCGSLAGTSTIINMVTFGEKRDEYLQNNQIVDRLFWWYAEQNFPTDRFDDLSPIPGQVREIAMSPLCHTSVSRWVMAAGEQIDTAAKIERCAKVCGEVVFTATSALNAFFKGEWSPPAWQPSEEIEHCIGCHGPKSSAYRARRWNQQGHMECMMCHEDHG